MLLEKMPINNSCISFITNSLTLNVPMLKALYAIGGIYKVLNKKLADFNG